MIPEIRQKELENRFSNSMYLLVVASQASTEDVGRQTPFTAECHVIRTVFAISLEHFSDYLQ